MKSEKICPYCNTRFVAKSNAKKYCRKQCALLASRRKTPASKKCLCLWCGQVFKAARRRKFCAKACRSGYLAQLGIYLKKEVRIPVRITVNDVAKQSRIQGISYGKYVCLKKL